METFKIALSAGHGKNTAGKRCMKSIDPKQTREWVLNARIAEKVEDLLLDYTGWELLRMDDRTGTKDIALKTRSNSANNWGADFYLAIHHNAGINGGKGGGIVVYVYTDPSADELKWQKDLYNALIEETGLKGNRSAPLLKANFHECREPKMTAVLLELGFMDSTTDVPIILSEKYADQCAAAIVDVIVKRGKLKKKTSSTSKVEIKVDPAMGFTEAKAGTYMVKSHDGILNLRSGADRDKTLIEVMENGSCVMCYGYFTGEWLLVISESGRKGFCNSKYLVKK